MTEEEKWKAIIDKAVQGSLDKIAGAGMKQMSTANIALVIFDKNFAKAFWGEELTMWSTSFFDITLTKHKPEWEHQLQVLVLQDSYIGYLYKFVS